MDHDYDQPSHVVDQRMQGMGGVYIHAGLFTAPIKNSGKMLGASQYVFNEID